MFAEFILPVIAYLITLVVLWATVAITKMVATRVSMPAPRPMLPTMVGNRTH